MRLEELRALQAVAVGAVEDVVGQGLEELGVGPLAGLALALQGGELEGLGLGRAGGDADAAAGTVLDVDLDLVLELAVVLGLGRDGLEGGRGVLEVLGVDLLGADHGVGAGHGALVALDAVRRDPLRHDAGRCRASPNRRCRWGSCRRRTSWRRGRRRP